jgi:tetratricopeptide (TPR) repeat protein
MRVLRQSFLVFLVVFAVLVAFEARFPALDPLTVKEPHPVRALVAGLAMRELGPADNQVDRILALDPSSARAWERRCTAAIGPSPATSVYDCQRAYEFDPSAANLRAVASAQESAGQACEAEATYREAYNKADLGVRKPLVLRDEARAALTCGHPGTALQALEQAEVYDLAESTDTPRDPTQVADPSAAVRESLAADRGYMAVVYERMNQSDKAKQMCTAANPSSPGCSCELTGNALTCSQTNTYTYMVASR